MRVGCRSCSYSMRFLLLRSLGTLPPPPLARPWEQKSSLERSPKAAAANGLSRFLRPLNDVSGGGALLQEEADKRIDALTQQPPTGSLLLGIDLPSSSFLRLCSTRATSEGICEYAKPDFRISDPSKSTSFRRSERLCNLLSFFQTRSSSVSALASSE